MTDSEVFSTVQAIAKQEKFGMFDYFDWRFFSPAVAELTAKHVPDLYPHIEQYIKTNFADVWFQNLFVGYLPEQTLLRVFECFLSEGLFKFAPSNLCRKQSYLQSWAGITEDVPNTTLESQYNSSIQ